MVGGRRLWRECADVLYVLGTFYIRFFCYQGYDMGKNRKASCIILSHVVLHNIFYGTKKDELIFLSSHSQRELRKKGAHAHLR